MAFENSAFAICVWKNLKPHCVSLTDGATERATERNTAPPTRLRTGCASTYSAPEQRREPITTGWPDVSSFTTGAIVSTGVERSASQNPTYRAELAKIPRLTAAPLPRRRQPIALTGTER